MTLDDARRVEAAASPAARALIIYLLAVAAPLTLGVLVVHGSIVRIVLTTTAPIALVVGLVLAWRFRRTSPERANPWILWPGLLALVGSAAFDVVVTAIRDPFLAYESNPWVRMLIEGGHSVTFVKAFGVTCQVLAISLLATLLWASLAHVEPLRVLAWSIGPRNRKEFIAAATRGNTDTAPLNGLRLRDWQAMKAHPWVAWLGAVLGVASPVGRSLFGLEWLGYRLPPAGRLALILVVTMLTISIAWSLVWKRGRPPGLDDAPADPPRHPAEHGLLAKAVPVGFFALIILAGPAYQQIRAALPMQATLDGRIAELRRDLDEAREAESRPDEIAADIARLRLEWESDPASRALPCDLDGPTLVAAIRSRLGLLGVEVDAETGPLRPRRFDYYVEHPVHVSVPTDAGAVERISVALRGSELHFTFWAEPGNPKGMLVAYRYTCPDLTTLPPVNREPPYGRERLVWPFDRGVARREREVEALLAERDLHAGALLLAYQERALAADIPRRKAVLDKILRKAR